MKITIPRSLVKALSAWSISSLVIAGLIGINILGYFVFYRFDLTEEKSYTVSSATKNILRELPESLNIKVFISKNLPPEYQVVAEYVKDIIEEYQKYSSNIKVELIDPIEKADKAGEADSLGIQNIQFQVLDKDEFKVQKGYLGLAVVKAEDEKVFESIPFVQSQENLEYELTSIINKLTVESMPIAGFVTGHNEYGINAIPAALMQQFGNGELENGEYSEFANQLRKHYQVKAVDLKKPESLKDVSVLIVGGPKKDFTQVELYNLDQYVLSGGKLIVLADRVLIDPTKGLIPTEANESLATFIEHYGLTLNKDLVIDKNNEMVSFTSGNTQYFLPYPFWIKIADEGFNKKNPATSKLSAVSLPFVSSVSGESAEGLTINTLIASSKGSSTVGAPFNLDPQQKFNISSYQPHAIAMEARGLFTPFFSEAPRAGEGEAISKAPITNANAEGVVILVGDADFLMNTYLQRNPANLALGLNLVDYLGQSEALIGIRAKSLRERTIRNAEENEILGVRLLNGAVIPLAVIGLGFFRFRSRQKTV